MIYLVTIITSNQPGPVNTLPPPQEPGHTQPLEWALLVKVLRELAGSAQYWAVSAPEISPYLPVFYRLLQQEPGDHLKVCPRGSPEKG